LIFVEGRVIDGAVIASLAGQLGLDAPTFHRELAAPETLRRHEGLVEEARSRGAFGVPTFFLGDRMFWGNDRLVLLEAALTTAPRAEE
jgi:2-hydroxychromene-2-carboxylate isomerase